MFPVDERSDGSVSPGLCSPHLVHKDVGRGVEIISVSARPSHLVTSVALPHI